MLLLLLAGTCVGREIAGDYPKRLGVVLKLLGFGCMLYAFQIVVIYPFILFEGSWPDIGTFARHSAIIAF